MVQQFFSPLSVDDFIKKSSIIGYSEEALRDIHKDIEAFAEAEQLTAHANSIKSVLRAKSRRQQKNKEARSYEQNSHQDKNDKGDGYYGNSEPGWNRKDGD